MVRFTNEMSFHNVEEIRGTVFQLWEKIPKDTILAYIEKIPDKLEYIKKHNGDVYSDHKDRA